MYGNQLNVNQEATLDLTRPALIQSHNKSEAEKEKLLHIQFETNPLDENCDYRIFARLQSLDMTYHAVTFLLSKYQQFYWIFREQLITLFDVFFLKDIII
jgi:hypothetical protein